MSITRQRLVEERKNWRKERPFGFVATPRKKPDGETDLMIWDCWIPGKDNTPWASTSFKLEMVFRDDYPSEPPMIYFRPRVFHINVFENGQVCLSLLYSDKDWRPSISVKQLLLGVQEMLDNPNPASVACNEAYNAFTASKTAYNERIRREVAAYRARYNSPDGTPKEA